MGFNRPYYEGLVYGVPLSFFVLIFIFLTVVNKRLNWLIIRGVLGIGFEDGDGTKSEEQTKEGTNKDVLGSYLYIDFTGEKKEDSARLTCMQRFLSDMLASAILAIFIAIIFNSLILATESVQANGQCPKFDAECFGGDRINGRVSFNCTPNISISANLSSSSKTWWCVGWIYNEMNVKDVLDTLGTCGGLLGLVSSIVPFVYYFSYYKNCACSLSVTWIVPCIPFAALALVIWHTWPVGPSVLAFITLVVLIVMVYIGWSWAARRSCGPQYYTKKCCGPIDCSSFHCDNWCYRILTTKYKSYPWCCYNKCCEKETLSQRCYKCCRSHCCYNDCLDCCCGNEAENYKGNNGKSMQSPVHTAIQVEPMPSKKQSLSPTNQSRRGV